MSLAVKDLRYIGFLSESVYLIHNSGFHLHFPLSALKNEELEFLESYLKQIEQ